MRASHSTSKHLLCHTVPASHRRFVRQSGGVFLRLDQRLCVLDDNCNSLDRFYHLILGAGFDVAVHVCGTQEAR